MVTASFGGVLVRTPPVANAFAAAMARLRLLAQHLLHRLDTGRQNILPSGAFNAAVDLVAESSEVESA